jgi:error-prone DNA polymerase
VSEVRDKLIDGMVAQRLRRATSPSGRSQLEGFGSYGFPESHAASFALIAYASSWIKCWHPDVFCGALNSAADGLLSAPPRSCATRAAHGVEVRPVCVNARAGIARLSRRYRRSLRVRLGLRLVKGSRQCRRGRDCRGAGRRALRLGRRSLAPGRRAGAASLVELAEADAFRPDLELARRDALWAIKALRDEPLPLFAAATPRATARSCPSIREPAFRCDR